MARIVGIPTTRVSDAFITRRMLSQLQQDQLNLFRVQNAISTGQRLTLPSEDPSAALRAISLQSLLERKTTIRTNLVTSQSYLSASDTALSNVSAMLNEVRASALAVIGTTASDTQREAAAIEVDRAIQQLLGTANQQFRGRYLFSGSRTLQQPFVYRTGGIEYRGNDTGLMSYTDIDALFQTNITGQEVFGAISNSLQGSVDLNPILRPETRLSDLRGGAGIRPGSVAISNGSDTRVVDISSAATIGDVARMLEANAPGGSRLTARVTVRGLEISLDSGDLSIAEVGGGTTAAELGIRRVGIAGPGPIVGEDLNPRLTLTTRLDDILATRAVAYLTPMGNSNDIVFEASIAGPGFNNVTVKLIDDSILQASGGLTAGDEVVTYHATASAAVASLTFPTASLQNNDILITATVGGTAFNNVQVSLVARPPDGNGIELNYAAGPPGHYSISVEAGVHSALDVVNAIQTDAALNGGPFTAALDQSADSGNDGSYVFLATDSNLNAGNTYNSGNDAGTLAIRIQSGSSTANQVIAKVNEEGTFRARLDVSEPGNTGKGAIFDSISDPLAIAVTSGGSGTPLDRASGLQITNGGQTYRFDLLQANTIEDLLNTINGLGAGVLAEINANGTGINVRSRLSGSQFFLGENGGTTATQLGLRSLNGTTALSQLNLGLGVRTVPGADFRIQRRDGVTFDVNLSAGVSASARIDPVGDNNALIFSRVNEGPGGNQFQVQIVDSGPGGGNSVNQVGNVLLYSVDLGAGFTAQDAIDLLAADPGLSTAFHAALDTAADPDNDGTGNLTATAPVSFTGGQSPAKTIDDVLAIINNHPVNLGSGIPVVARLTSFGNGIEFVNDGPPASHAFQIQRLNFSEAAVDLGLIPAGADVSSPTTSGAVATTTFTLPGANNDFTISATASGELLNGVTIAFIDDGIPSNNALTWSSATRTLTFNIDPATTTPADLVALVNANPVTRALFHVAPTAVDNGSPNTAMGHLGTLPASQTLAGGTNDVLAGTDPNPTEVGGMFTALIRLSEALRANDLLAMEHAIEMLDASAIHLNFARAELGARQRGLDVLQARLDVEEVELKSALSLEIDVDLVAAISELMARQTTLEASLRAAAATARMTLLDFL